MIVIYGNYSISWRFSIISTGWTKCYHVSKDNTCLVIHPLLTITCPPIFASTCTCVLKNNFYIVAMKARFETTCKRTRKEWKVDFQGYKSLHQMIVVIPKRGQSKGSLSDYDDQIQQVYSKKVNELGKNIPILVKKQENTPGFVGRSLSNTLFHATVSGQVGFQHI